MGSKAFLAFGTFKSMEEAGEIYAKDFEDGIYHSRFGFEVWVIDGQPYKVLPSGDLLPISPNDYSVFKKGPLRPSEAKR
jgi:hypothetical protein